ncbi:MAG: hypothetical protein K8T91_02500 [Planctomycetes bacterium]|nr:hypothetical protein [Planctomycetota bacterium]
MTDPHDNPYASPSLESSTIPASEVSEDAVWIRQKYIGVETTIRAIGGLLFVACLPPAVVALGGIRDALGYGDIQHSNLTNVIILFTSIALLAIGLFMLAIGLRRFHPLARIPGAVTMAVMLAATLFLGWRWWFFTGTIAAVEIYVFYILIGKQGQFIFSKEYVTVRRHTPHIKYRASGLASLMLIVVFVLLAIGMFVPAIP